MIKFEDAQLLLKHGRFSNAYYLAGYALEFGIKACIAKQIAAETIPLRDFVNNVYKHKLQDLITTAGLGAELKAQQDRDQTFQAYWGLAGDWSPDIRYTTVDKMTAHQFLQAVGDPEHGILPWIRTVW